ncbi:MAG: helix-turn-helix domain-containing protein [Panacagrimonas sp.]
MAKPIVIRGVEAYRRACQTAPTIERRGAARTGVSLYGWGVIPDKEMHVPRSRELTVAIHLRGASRVRVFTERGLSHSVSRPGHITLIPRGQSITYLTDGEVEFATAHLQPTVAHLFEDRLGVSLLNLEHCLFAVRDEYVCSSVRTLLQAPVAAFASRDAQRYVDSLLTSMTWHLARVAEIGEGESVRLAQSPPGSRAAATPGEPDFDAVIVEIESRLGDGLGLEELARRAGVGRTRFVETFAQRFGCSPHRYIVGRRIERAKELLRNGQRSMTAIAYELGFSSPSHFSAAFKASMRVSPLAYADAQSATS